MNFATKWLSGLFLLAVLSIGLTTTVRAEVTDEAAIASLEATQAGFRLVHSRIAPSVVTITSAGRTSRATGSGVIIRSEGVVLTNRHVVENATRVTVQLYDTTRQLPAEIVQTDERTDLAIVRITEAGTYPAATLGDSRSVRVGDWSIAFGSPYGLRSTMTVGVISAVGRRLEGPVGDFNYYDLLQTDAAINQGNSGGPLVNIRAEVVGINFMIFSPGENSGSVGIGFAIPINDFTKRIIDTLITGKKVERGIIGIQISPLTEAMQEQFKVKEGVLIQNVVPGGAGEKYGLKAEDVITAYNDTKITDVDQFIQLVQQTAPGTNVILTVVRAGTEQKIPVVLASDADTRTAAAGGIFQVNEESLGISVMALTPIIARQLGTDVTSGVVVTNVTPFSIAAEAGMMRGDVILRVADVNVTTVRDFWTTLDTKMAQAQAGVVLRVQNGKAQRTISLPKMNVEKRN